MTLYDRIREIALVNSTAQLLSWDQETYMPSAAADYRSEQLAYLAAHAHKLGTNREFLDALTKAQVEDDHSDPIRCANLKQIRRESDRAVKLPTELIAQESIVQSNAHHAWIAARKTSDYNLFAPHLAKLIEISQQKAELWGYVNEPYDALLEVYERGTSTAEIAQLFDSLLTELAPLAACAVQKTSDLSPSLPAGPYPIDAQKKFNALVAFEIGFDFDAGRIDTTTHPFCTTLGPRDVRLTTRYMESDFTSSLFGIMHEAGHGLYELGLPAADFGLPSGSAVSLGIHESQSRLWENQIGRSRIFWEKFYPIAQEHFSQLASFPLDNFLQYIQRAAFSPIRVEADEATYDLHIILRFQIERMLMNREIDVQKVPSVWNDLFQQSFGFLPPNDSQGCLQDIHWSMGGIGYFPTYTLGNINAAQLYRAATEQSTLCQAVEKADYSSLLEWLRTNVHQHGGIYAPRKLMEKATGNPPSTRDYISHLKNRYL